MDTKIAKQIAHLTEINHHTEAGIMLAEQYAYCADLLKILKALRTIHETIGYMPLNLQLFRSGIMSRVIKRIHKAEGKKEIRAIHQLI